MEGDKWWGRVNFLSRSGKSLRTFWQLFDVPKEHRQRPSWSKVRAKTPGELSALKPMCVWASCRRLATHSGPAPEKFDRVGVGKRSLLYCAQHDKISEEEWNLPPIDRGLVAMEKEREARARKRSQLRASEKKRRLRKSQKRRRLDPLFPRKKCHDCSKDPEPDRSRCATHQIMARESNVCFYWSQKRKGKRRDQSIYMLGYRRSKRARGECYECKEPSVRSGRCEPHAIRHAEIKAFCAASRRDRMRARSGRRETSADLE